VPSAGCLATSIWLESRALHPNPAGYKIRTELVGKHLESLNLPKKCQSGTTHRSTPRHSKRGQNDM
jgi:hypothetical protein